MNDLHTPRQALYRSSRTRILGGVCGGISEVYGWDVNLVRLITFVVVATTGIGPLLYLAAWLLLPLE